MRPLRMILPWLKTPRKPCPLSPIGLTWQAGDNIVSSNEEFPSNRLPWQSLANQGVEFRQADLHSADTPEDALFALVDSNTRLLTISSIQFASGLRYGSGKDWRILQAARHFILH